MSTAAMNIWVKDENHRVYADRGSAQYGSPIFREYFVKSEVIGETKQSWIISHYDEKVPKNPAKRPFGRYAFSEEELDQIVYVHDNHLKIAEQVRDHCTYDQLTQIAKIIGYGEPHE